MSKGLWSVLLVCSAMVLTCPRVRAQAGERTIRHYLHTAWTARDGAPPEIWAMDQGPDGFLWLGTGSGLYRFDGIRFERYRPAPGQRLASIDITALRVLASNEMWIGYSDGGISRLRDGQVTTFLEKDGLWPGMLVRIVQDHQGILWAVSHGGLSRFENGRWHRLEAGWNIPSGVIVELFAARDGTLWLSSAQSIYFLRPGARRFEATGAVSQHATFTQTPDGQMWVADALHGLRPLPDYPSGNSQSPWPLQNAVAGNVLSVPNFAVDRQGVIWATDRLNGGIFRFDPRKSPHPSRSLLASDITDVFRRADGLTADRSIPILNDREGNIWVGTNGGLNRFRATDIIPDAAVPATTAFGYSIAATPDATYIADGEWLYRALPNEGARRFAHLAPGRTTLFGSREGALWYGNGAVLHSAHEGQVLQIPPPAGVVDDNIVAITEDSAGTLRVTFERAGVFMLRADAWAGKLDLGDLPSPAVTQFDPRGALWLGFSGNRVARHDATGIRVFSDHDGLEVGGVEAITIRDGAVWVGGEFGVARLEGERFRTIGPERVAAMFGISGIEQTADGDFVFNGLLGAVRMHTEELRKAFADSSYAPAHDLYDRSDGLPGVAQQGWHSPTIVTGADSRIWFISNTGVAVLAPERLERNLLPPPVTILSASAEGAVYPVAGPLRLPTGASSLTIAYAAASLGVPERVRFRYKLEGLDPDWVDAGGHREAVYNTVSPGRYRFRVIAANEDGVWNTDGAVLDLDIPPTFLQSWPFTMLCAVTVVGLLSLAYSMRLRVVADRIRMRTAERMEERERIARELHDTLLQSVQALTLRFQLVVDDLPSDARARATLEEALDRADMVIAEGRDRVRDLRTRPDCDVDRMIADIIKRQAFDPGVDITLTTTGAALPLEPLVLEEAARIASEAIFNIWRHASATRVAIDIGHGATFSLRIADNGLGIPRELADRGQKEGHFGLSGMHERARKLGGWLAVRVLPEGGTEVLLTVTGQIAYKSLERRMSLW